MMLVVMKTVKLDKTVHVVIVLYCEGEHINYNNIINVSPIYTILKAQY